MMTLKELFRARLEDLEKKQIAAEFAALEQLPRELKELAWEWPIPATELLHDWRTAGLEETLRLARRWIAEQRTEAE